MDGGKMSTEAATPINEPLTEREIAILRGDDPDTAKDGGETVTDDHQISEHVPSGTAETGISSQETDGAGQDASEAGGDKDVPAGEWATDEHKELAASIGADLAGLPNAEALVLATQLHDKRLIDLASASAAVDKPTEPAPKPISSEAKPPAGAVEKIDPQKYIDEGYNDETVAMARAARDAQDRTEALEREFREFQQSLLQTQAKTQEAQLAEMFHTAVDQLDATRYGRAFDDSGNPQKLDPSVDANREKLWKTADLIVEGIKKEAALTGKQPVIPALHVVLKRAEQFAFSKEILEAERKAMQDKIASQSKRRRPAAGRSRTVTPPPEKPADQVQTIMSHPSMVKLFKKMDEDTGQ
jgi:hypothetical protein